MDAQPEHVRLLLGIRKLRHWTQEDLARELQVSARTIRRWENGESEPNARDLETFRRLLMYEESVSRFIEYVDDGGTSGEESTSDSNSSG